jgi:hypothetical protein
MTELDRATELVEDRADQVIPTDVGPLIGDEREEVARGKEVGDEESVGRGLDGLMEREDGRMRGEEGVKVNLALLKLALTGGEGGVGEDFDGYMHRIIHGRRVIKVS